MSDSLAERYIAQFAKQGTPFVGRDLCERMLRDVELSGKLQGVTKALEELIHYLTPDGRAKAQAMLEVDTQRDSIRTGEETMTTEHQPGSPGAVDLDALDELHRAVSPAPWEVDTVDSDGFKARAMYSNGRSVFDSLNSESATVEEDSDGEVAGDVYRWDSTARADFEFIAALRNAYAPIVAELRTLRARVGELEASANELNGPLSEEVARMVHAFPPGDSRRDDVRHIASRITDLESQLAAAREEQGLEAKVREVLGERFDHLNASRCIVNGAPEWFTDTRNIWPHHSFVSEPTLPALLRAILEVENKS